MKVKSVDELRKNQQASVMAADKAADQRSKDAKTA
jgi:hypothetical protein